MTKIEEVARAMVAEIDAQEYEVYRRIEPEDPINFMLIDGRVDMLAVARAAIKDMRVPNHTMLMAATNGKNVAYNLDDHYAMIDAALNEVAA